MSSTTEPRSIWTDTVMDMLLDTLRRDGSEAEIKYFLKQLRAKGMRANHILQAVRAILGESAAKRISRFTRKR